MKDLPKAIEAVALFSEYEYKETKLMITFAKRDY